MERLEIATRVLQGMLAHPGTRGVNIEKFARAKDSTELQEMAKAEHDNIVIAMEFQVTLALRYADTLIAQSQKK